MTALCVPRDLRRPVARLAPAGAAEVVPEPPASSSLTIEPLRVGLLGGSFNPAHEGHRYISLEALKRLDLDQVWWLVSPQNPLKPVAGMAPLAQRLARAKAVARHPRIRPMALETRLRTRYTIDTVRRLCALPDHRFVWLMGADNLGQIPRWRHWRAIFETLAIAVFERHPYSYAALAGAAARRYADARLPDARACDLLATTPPAWVFVRLRPHPASATAIRARGGA